MTASLIRHVDPNDPAFELTLKEAVAASLLNQTHHRVTGAGGFGDVILDGKPSKVLSAAFLLPATRARRNEDEETGQTNDAVTPIHLATVGMAFQLRGRTGGQLLIRPYGSVYVRVLPTSQEILADRHVSFRLSRDLQRQLTELRREFIQRAVETHAQVIARAGRRSPEWRRIKGEAVRAARDELERRIARRVELEAELVGEQEETLRSLRNGTSEATPAGDATASLVDDLDVGVLENLEAEEQRDEDGEIIERGRLTVFPGMPNPPSDELVDPAEIPQKWRRLEVGFPSLEIDLSANYDQLTQQLEAYGATLTEAVQRRISSWENDPDPDTGGQRWACPAPEGRRGGRVSPSEVVAWEDTIVKFSQDENIAHPRPQIRLAVEIDITHDPISPGQRTARVILRNASQVLDPTNPRSRFFEHGIFQVRLECELNTDLHQPLTMERIRPSYRWNEWLTYPGLGVNCGIVASRGLEGNRVTLSTTYLPIFALPRIEPFRLDPPPTFKRLASDDGGVPVLDALASSYARWISGVITEEPWKKGLGSTDGGTALERERAEFQRDVTKWQQELEQIKKGISVLRRAVERRKSGLPDSDHNVVPLTAWRAMNSAFADGKHQQWHLFQLAFIVSQLPGLSSRIPDWTDRTELSAEELAEHDSTAALLYFSTGGGKSEAFFGTIILALFLDRLRGKTRGVTALVRYPLRLLTAQQANRFAEVLARAERVRRRLNIPGEPFEIGFWVGSGNTPNSPSDEGFEHVPNWEDLRTDEEEVIRSHPGYRGILRWKRLVSCPFCGSQSVGLRSRREARTKRLAHVCLNPDCDWSKWHEGYEPLPFHVMDTDIYGYAPSVLIGTVDKTSMIGHSAHTIARVFGMFGFAPWQYVEKDSRGQSKPGYGRLVQPRNENQFRAGPDKAGCRRLWPAYQAGERVFYDPYPSLVIQDEAHLLEESLGTFSGLFETMFETALSELAPLLGQSLASLNGNYRRYKVIAASATVSEPVRQIRMLYQREVAVFPHPGPDLYQSFFARLRPPDPSDIGRDEIDNPEIRTPTRRIYASLPTNGKPHTSATVAILSAMHLAISEFFDMFLSDDPSLREAARRRISDNIPIDIWHRWRKEALDRSSDNQLGAAVDLHRIVICYVTTKKGGDNVRAALHEFTQRDHKRVGIKFGERGGIRTELITGAIDMESIQAVVEMAKPRWTPNETFERNRDSFDALRGVIATSAISHGVDVEQFNSIVFAGLPADVAEYIQASSRVGRTHVGLSLLVPTPQTIRDVHVVEIHDIFHRFLERMVRPAPVDRWAEQAIVRVLSSALMIKACAVDYFNDLARATEADKAATLPSDRISRVRARNNNDPVRTVAVLGTFFERGIGLDPSRPAYWPNSSDWYESDLENRTRHWVNEMGNPMFGTSGLRTFFENVGAPLPMTSLRDVDEAGIIKVSGRRSQGLTRLNAEEVRELMRLLRQGGAAWGEGEDDVPDSAEFEREEV